jgi:esterase/lipase superfamily enzyme
VPLREISALFRLSALALTLIAAGCANQQAAMLIGTEAIAADESQLAGRHSIFVATTRERSNVPNEVFAGERSLALSYAVTDVTVPRAHKVGAVEHPPARGARDPSRHFNASAPQIYGEEKAFVDDLARSIKERGGRALVFIHGYNTRFDHAVYRLTQIAHDSGYDGAVVLFTWASRGRTVDYIYDRDSAHVGRDGLERTLRLVQQAGASRIDIIAHSMGNWVTLEALRQFAISGDRDLGGKLGDVILASPDVDVDVFKSQMKRYGRPEKPFFVMLSRNDRALNISGMIAGNRPRLGEYADADDIAQYGVVVINVTDVESSGLNHTKFAENPVLISLMGERLRSGDALTEAESDLTGHIDTLARSLGQTAVSAASIVITTPAAVVGAAVDTVSQGNVLVRPRQ